MSKIEWVANNPYGMRGETWSPITGCSPISEGCTNCYARRMASRLKGRYGYPKDDPFRVTFHEDRLRQPYEWRKPRMIFVSSMGDLFHEKVPYKSYRPILFSVYRNSQHLFLFLTKRPERMQSILAQYSGHYHDKWPFKNLWLGTTVEHPDYLHRVETLLQIPAAKRFVSIEPMLSGINLTRVPGPIGVNLSSIDALTGRHYHWDDGGQWTDEYDPIDWVIVGGESGPGARPMHSDWARSVRDQCQAAGTKFLFKQWGEWQPQKYYGDIDVSKLTIDSNAIPSNTFKFHQWEDGSISHKFGKIKAGRLLDNREWMGFPDNLRKG